VKPRNLLLLTALALEAKAVAAAFEVNPPSGKRLLTELRPGISLRLIGLRAVRLQAEHLAGFDAVILTGLAGGLDPSLAVGDIIVDAPATTTDAPDAFPTLAQYRHGRIVTCKDPITTIEGKAALFAETGALAAEMEADHVRRLTDAAGLPLAQIRAVSDTASEALPEEPLSWIDDIGTPKMTKVTFGLIKHPKLLPILQKLSHQADRAADAVAQAILKALEARDN
jgi:adenosylhomocysteine nucleosidase